MRIESVQTSNHYQGWRIETINFQSNLTLLVGGSGVGKTQILRSISNLRNIALGKAINGFGWSIRFSTSSGNKYDWSGKFTTNSKLIMSSLSEFDQYEDDQERAIPLEYEKLVDLGENKVILERKPNEILYNGIIMPKLASTKSVVNTLKEEPIFEEVINAFRKIFYKDHTQSERDDYRTIWVGKSLEKLRNELDTYEKIKNSGENLKTKLFLAYEHDLPEVRLITNRIKEIFPQIIDLKIEQFEDPETFVRPDFTLPIIFIKEKGVDNWIRNELISSGMLRTLYHIADLYLSNDESVILIDEFENSLGVNCIDILTEDLLYETSNIQYIATSHHPYIINNIPYEHWKIVSRKGGDIFIKNASDYKMGKSKQSSFIQLTKILEMNQA